ncbi:reverse transcriptase domain-containing protein [Tanacetum coccineum]|uniref:Reverse transcriptase domain-containing protein n=1 Tax=Tanacetum coccineum TaxID=301880 RepID=A0ABQ5ESC2_9ASTR
MTAIFHEHIEDSKEVFMDDFSVFGNSFDHCLKNLGKMLKRCKETNLVLNWEKFHFMVKEGIVLGHKVLGLGIKVDKENIKAISKLPYPANVRSIRSFLGHAGFYRRFIKDFSKITRPMTQLLVKDTPFNFSAECIQAFNKLKYHSALQYLFTKQDVKPRLIRCILVLQEIDIKIHDNKGAENLVADHLSRLENPDLGKLTKAEIRDLFPEERLMVISNKNNEPCVLTESYEGAWPEIRRCVAGDKAAQILRQCHSRPSGGHHGIVTTARKNVVNFLRRLFPRFRIPKALIRDRGTHLCNYQMEKEMKRYGVVHRFLIAYHPQTNGQVENTNREIKRILDKTTGNNRKDWSYKLDDALWAFRIAFKTTLRTTPFRIIYDNACYLPVKLEHKAYWVIKNYTLDLMKAGANRFLQINELDKMRLDAYESSISYKERIKRWHDKHIKALTNYERGDKVLLFNSRLRLFPRKLKSRWYRPFSVCKNMKNGAIELYDEDGNESIINKQRVKPYQKRVLDTNRDEDMTLDDEGEVTLYLMRRSLEVLRKFHWMILGGRFNQLSHVSSPLLSKPGEY